MELNRLILAIVVVFGVPTATIAYVWLVEQGLARLPGIWQERVRPWFWLGPALILLGLFLVYPSLNTFRLSFMNARSTDYVGFDNYIFAFTDPAMLTTLRNNGLWLVFMTGFVVLFGLIFAIMSDRVRYESTIKAAIFLPMAISYVASGVIWKLMYEWEPPGQPQTGTINAVLDLTIPGFEPQTWLINSPINNFALILIGVWMWTGFAMVILSAGLKGIPVELIEAARIDGASEWQVLRHVTLPLLASTIAVVTTTMVINVLKIFDIVYVMTNGNFETEVIANRMYKEMFIFRDFGRASALAVVLFLAIVPIMAYNIDQFRQQEAQR